MTEAWLVTALLNGAAGLAFVAVGLNIAVQLTRSGQWSANRVSSVFSVLVVACGLGHAGRAALALAPAVGLFAATGEATRVVFADWHMWVADGMTAAAGVAYLIARVRDRDVLESSKAFRDYHARRARGLEVHDGIVQDLVTARMALQNGERERASSLVGRALETSKHIISGVDPTPTADRAADDPDAAAGLSAATLVVGPALLVALLALPIARAHAAGTIAAGPQAPLLWIGAAAVNLAMAAMFVWIAIPLWRSIRAGSSLAENPLLLGMALIFTTCAGSHLLHVEHSLIPYYLPALGIGGAEAVAFGGWAQLAMSNPLLLAVDVVTAFTAIWYVGLRLRQRNILQGASLAQDLRERAEEARRMQDTTVQHLTRARIHLKRNRDEAANAVLDEALADTKAIVHHFLGEERATLAAGDLTVGSRGDD